MISDEPIVISQADDFKYMRLIFAAMLSAIPVLL